MNGITIFIGVSDDPCASQVIAHAISSVFYIVTVLWSIPFTLSRKLMS